MFSAIKKILSFEKSLDGIVEKVPDLIGPGEDQTEIVCLCALELPSSAINYFELQKIGCNTSDIARAAITNMNCDELLPLADSLPVTQRDRYLNIVEHTIVECLGSNLPWYKYYDSYSNLGNHLQRAYERYLDFSIRQEQHWDFIFPNKNLAINYKGSTLPSIKNTVENVSDLEDFNNVFQQEEDYEWALNWAIDNLSPEELGNLIGQVTYSNYIPTVESKIINRAQINIEYGYLAINKFPINSDNLSAAYTAVIRQETDTSKRNEVILDYIDFDKEKALPVIHDLLLESGQLAFLVAEKYISIRDSLQPICLNHVNNEYSFNVFANLFPNWIDYAFDRIYKDLNAESLRIIHSKYQRLRPRVAEIYLEAVASYQDVQWFLKNYKENPRRKKAYTLGFEYLEEGAKKTKLTVSYLKEFNLDVDIVRKNINCSESLYFLEAIKFAPNNWYSELVDFCLKCLRIDNLSEYEVYFGHLPEFHEEARRAIKRSLQVARSKNLQIPAVSIGTLRAIDTITESFSLVDYDNAVLVFDADNLSGLEVKLFYDGQERTKAISENDAIIFIPSSTKKMTIELRNKKSKKFFKSSDIELLNLYIYDCPSIIRSRVESIISNEEMRNRFLGASERLVQQAASRTDYEMILGEQFLQFVEEEAPIAGELKVIASYTALLYLDIVKPYIKRSYFEKIMAKLEKVVNNKLSTNDQ